MDQSNFLLSSDQNVQKEFINIPATVLVPGTYAYVDFPFVHGLNYIASAHVWYEALPGKWFPLALNQMQDGPSDFLGTTGAYSLTLDSIIVSMVNFTGSNVNVNLWIRVYLDN